MSLKSRILHRVNRMNGLVARHDLPGREPDFAAPRPAPREAGQGSGRPGAARTTESVLSEVDHLGSYAALIAAIRDELEHFVASHVRLHVAIADRDRFVLTSIAVRCPGAPESRELLHRFLHEFKPEQVKRYLAREVIAGLANASAIDLSQFAGLRDADARDDSDDGDYAELLAVLRSVPPAALARPYEVTVLGRWTELDPALAAASDGQMRPRSFQGAAPPTPLAGPRVEFEVDDADGRRRVVLQAVVPGRRYVIGKGEGADIRVNGIYASRRHAEVWLDGGAWWIGDAGSTNGIRVESPSGSQARTGAHVPGDPALPVRLRDAARVILSARAEGPPGEYPCVALRSSVVAGAPLTPIAVGIGAPKTPLTAVLPGQDGPAVEPGPLETAFRITAVHAAGIRTLELRPSALPVTVGRSRNQTFVVDRRHEGVSGHHLDIVGLDAVGAEVVVLGDNGVTIGGTHHPEGARCRWRVGETMRLGSAPDDHPDCTLTLARQGQG